MRVHYVKLPRSRHPKLRWAVVLGLAATILVLGHIALFNLLNRRFVPYPSGSSPSVPPWLVFTLSTAVLLLVWVYSRWRRRLRSWPTERWRRLERMLGQPDCARRFPHRVIEHRLRTHPWQGLVFQDVSEQAAPGTVVVVNAPQELDRWRLPRHELRFEPVDLMGKEQEILNLAGALTGMDWNELTADSERANVGLRRWSIRRRALAGWFTLFLLYTIFIWAAPVTSDTRRSGFVLWLAQLPLALLLLATGGSPWGAHWIVPGGLVRTVAWPWRRCTGVKLVTNADGVLVINFRSRQAMAGNRGYVVKHLFGRRAHVWQAVLAAWLTRAPAVTMEQMLAFVGPDAVPAEGRKGG